MEDPPKRQRTSTLPPPEPKPVKSTKPAKPATPPPSHFIGRVCRLRLVHQSDAWLHGKLLSCSGPNKQTCEIELDNGGFEGAPRRVEKVHLSTQPVHVLDDVCWGPEEGAMSELGQAAASLGGGRSIDDLNGGPIGGYVAGLVPMLLFTNFGPAELDAETDSTLRLAQSLRNGEHVWVRRAGTRPLAAQMMRRRTGEKMKPAVEAARQAEMGLQLTAHKAAKKGVVGRRLTVYWPIDDAWYFGKIEAWDPKLAQHRVLYDDGCAPPGCPRVCGEWPRPRPHTAGQPRRSARWPARPPPRRQPAGQHTPFPAACGESNVRGCSVSGCGFGVDATVCVWGYLGWPWMSD